jgi:aminotransferase
MEYSKFLNPEVTAIPPSGIRKFFDIANTMEGVISLGVGEPDFVTPWKIRKAGITSLENGRTRYTANRGLADLRREITVYLKRKYGLSYDGESDVLVTIGGSEAIDAVIRSLVCPGEEVLIPQPSYVCYEPMTRLAGGVPVIIETKAENEFKLTPEELLSAITDKTKLLILPYPCNPTGSVMEKEDLEKIARVLVEKDIFVLSDEIYSELTYVGEHCSIASVEGMKERTVVVNGFSKAFSMTGWRLGYACGPTPVLEQVTKIHQYAIMCAPTTAQYAAIEALKNCDEEVAQMKEEYDMRRRLMVSGFNRLGLSCHEPKGAFYTFPSIKKTGMTSNEFCEKLLMSEKVALVPGTAFGNSGEGFVRASYCYSIEHIARALARIERFMKKEGVL